MTVGPKILKTENYCFVSYIWSKLDIVNFNMLITINVLLIRKSNKDCIVIAGPHSLHTLKVCTKHNVIPLSSCQDILFCVLTYLRVVMFQ